MVISSGGRTCFYVQLDKVPGVHLVKKRLLKLRDERIILHNISVNDNYGKLGETRDDETMDYTICSNTPCLLEEIEIFWDLVYDEKNRWCLEDSEKMSTERPIKPDLTITIAPFLPMSEI